jgi:hypothetical protein
VKLALKVQSLEEANIQKGNNSLEFRKESKTLKIESD